MKTYTQEEVKHAENFLKEIITKGKEVYTLIPHVSQSGLSHWAWDRIDA